MSKHTAKFKRELSFKAALHAIGEKINSELIRLHTL